MKIAFAHNVYDRFKTLKETIDIEKKYFPNSKHYISCNSYENDIFFSQFNNLKFKYFLETPEHKIGCVNGFLLSCNMALDDDFDILVFSHDDVRLTLNHLNVAMSNINAVFNNEYNMIYRNPTWIGPDYAMMEVVIMNRTIAEILFSKIKLLTDESEIGCWGNVKSISPEFWFYNKIKNINLSKKVIKYSNDNELPQQMGFQHLNIGLRGWKDE
jgi:hypothetical protein